MKIYTILYSRIIQILIYLMRLKIYYFVFIVLNKSADMTEEYFYAYQNT
jgi:hypothetical protein